MRFLSTRAHSILDLIVALVLIFAPNIFGFSDVGGAAANIPRILGIMLLLDEAITDNGMSLAKIISMKAHLTSDIVVGIFLALSPWLFGFHDQGSNAWLPHLVVGILIIGNALVTRTTPDHSSNRTRAAAA
jgi:uncharacterized membrane protein YtjA (UPF0391 family)